MIKKECIMTDETKKALQESIDHWKRMKEYSGTKKPGEECDFEEMKNDLKEDIYGSSCILCIECTACFYCPLYEWKKTTCGVSNSYWMKCKRSKIWNEFEENAQIFIDVMTEILNGTYKGD
jgi:hypothetical protein